MRYIKRLAKLLAAIAAGAAFGLGVCAGVQWLLQSIAYGFTSPWMLAVLAAVLFAVAMILAALEK